MSGKVEIDTKQVRIPKKTIEQLDYLCKITNKSRQKILSEIVEAIYQVGIDFKFANMMFETSVLFDSVTITFTGSKRLIIGHFRSNESDAKVDKKIKRLAEKRLGK